MGGLIPLIDASRRPARIPIVTASIILANFLVFVLELKGGDAFVLKWSLVPAHITAGHDRVTILTAMFMHGSRSSFTWEVGQTSQSKGVNQEFCAVRTGAGGTTISTSPVATS